MTFEEKILFLAGRFCQLSQYCLENTIHLHYLLFLSEDTLKNTAVCISFTSAAKESLENLTFTGSKGVEEFLANSKISTKIKNEITFILKKRDYVVTRYFIDKAQIFDNQDSFGYNSIINELEEYIERAIKLNQDLANKINAIAF